MSLCKIFDTLKIKLLNFFVTNDNSPSQKLRANTKGHNSPVNQTINNTTIHHHPKESEETVAYEKLKHVVAASDSRDNVWLTIKEESELAFLIEKKLLAKTERKTNNAINLVKYEFRLSDEAKNKLSHTID